MKLYEISYISKHGELESELAVGDTEEEVVERVSKKLDDLDIFALSLTAKEIDKIDGYEVKLFKAKQDRG